MEPQACWILCTPRTGSTLLCELLNNLGVFSPFDHPLIPLCPSPLIEEGQAFNEWPRLYSSLTEFVFHPPPYSKMIFHQYVEMMGSVSKTNRYNIGWYPRIHDSEFVSEVIRKYGSAYIRVLFPDMKFIHLRRETISHAISLYFARETKKYHIYDRESLSKYLNTKISVDFSKLLEAYRDAISNDSVWDDFWEGDEDVLTVDYQEMISNPCQLVERITCFLGLDVKIGDCHIDRIFRMTRRESPEFEVILRKLIKASSI